jgi:hypothetical protein
MSVFDRLINKISVWHYLPSGLARDLLMMPEGRIHKWKK